MWALAQTEPGAWADLIKTLGFPLAALLIVLWSGRRGDWVWKREVDFRDALLMQRDADFKEMRRDRDEWKDEAMRGTRLAEQSVTVAERRRTPK